MSFQLDPRLAAESVLLASTAQALVLLRDESRWPWLVVVPQTNAVEFHDLESQCALKLMETVAAVAATLRTQPGVQKINLASFGNVVPQQHWHVIGRFVDDPHWPESVIGLERVPMAAAQLQSRAKKLRGLLLTRLDHT